MNLFVVGWSDAGPVPAAAASEAIDRLLSRLPFLTDEPRRSWSAPSGAAAAAWVSHGESLVGTVSYAAVELERLALWSGRPVLWTSDGHADGRAALDPTLYLRSSSEWAHRLDGRSTAVSYDDAERRLTVFSDPMGAYPVFLTEAGDVTWVSNNAELLRPLSGTAEIDTGVLAALLGGGWSLSGNPLWKSVRRTARGTVLSLRPGRRGTRELLGVADIVAMTGRPLDVEGASATLVANAAALADWPGRPNVVPTTAGRDSRLVLAAALAAGFEFTTVTGGSEDDPDVVIGGLIAQAAGCPHGRLGADPHGSMFSDWRRAAELVALEAAGTATLADAAGFPHGPREGPLALWHSGQGGEIARGYYGRVGGRTRAALVGSLYKTFVGRRPGRLELLSVEGSRLVRAELAAFVDEVMDAGAVAHDVGDLFYVLRRMGTWAGPTHGSVEWVRDTTSPLWSSRMLAHELAGTHGERARETFHLRLLERLAPQLVDLPLQGGQPWAAHQSETARRARRAAVLAGKAGREARSRLAPRLAGLPTRLRRGAFTGTPEPAASGPRAAASPGDRHDPFTAMRDDLRELVFSERDHPAWPLLDADRVRSLLERDPSTLDAMSQAYTWRLATVFGNPRVATTEQPHED
ncbi:MAG: hypothetical protein AVDCRST_MAG69-1328 [uncultured Solirubrobacteraceae bacterium]|uniref:Asparagine synthetase domain-containing protein n=1 Tax=uncultured Solirubrobacteraceae bacterium TaxID=1162706 RepID=A0A6J4S669_9ACTN|nr:MAG: hypothetical protein AVDCRST_MAG69-1328 [uncultured Solirubrobacteraceae bacterium]